MSDNLIYDSVQSSENDKKAFVVIHGWKGNKDSFKTIASLLKLDSITWFFPEAPFLVEGDENKKTWSYQREDGSWEVKKPKNMLNDFLVNHVFSRFKPKDVYVMGFSQGATVCYEYILGLNYTFAGIFPVAGFLRNPKGELSINQSHYNTPILIGHGRDDDVVPFVASEIAFDKINKVCGKVSLFPYNGKHKISVEYLREVRKIVNNDLK